MATITRFEELEIWKEARRLAKEIHFIAVETDLKNDFENLSGKINNFISYLNKKDFKGTKFQ